MNSNHEYDSFIFTHIPKCGGSSLRRLVYDSAIASGIHKEQLHIPGEGGIDHEKNVKQLSTPEYDRLTKNGVKILADHSKLDFGLYEKLGMNNPFVFTVFRAPFERFISHYNFFYKKVGHGKLKGKPIQSIGLNRLETIVSRQANVMAAYILNLDPGVDNTKTLIARLPEIENLISNKIDVVGTLDNIDSCIKQIGEKKPDWLQWTKELPQINTNKYQPDFQGIKKVRQVFVKYNQLDIKLYQYIKALNNLRSIKSS